jgi:hypothetical protein
MSVIFPRGGGPGRGRGGGGHGCGCGDGGSRQGSDSSPISACRYGGKRNFVSHFYSRYLRMIVPASLLEPLLIVGRRSDSADLIFTSLLLCTWEVIPQICWVQ